MSITKSARQTRAAVLLLGASLTLGSACGDVLRRAPIMVAHASLAAGQTIGQLQRTVKQLTKTADNPNGVIPPAAALSAQTTLLRINADLEPVPPLLRAIDAAQKAGAVDPNQVIQAITILQRVSGDLSIVVAGVPITDATAQVLELVKTGQTTITTLLVELGRVQGALGRSS